MHDSLMHFVLHNCINVVLKQKIMGLVLCKTDNLIASLYKIHHFFLFKQLDLKKLRSERSKRNIEQL